MALQRGRDAYVADSLNQLKGLPFAKLLQRGRDAYVADRATPLRDFALFLCFNGAATRTSRIVDEYGVAIRPLFELQRGRDAYVADRRAVDESGPTRRKASTGPRRVRRG